MWQIHANVKVNCHPHLTNRHARINLKFYYKTVITIILDYCTLALFKCLTWFAARPILGSLFCKHNKIKTAHFQMKLVEMPIFSVSFYLCTFFPYIRWILNYTQIGDHGCCCIREDNFFILQNFKGAKPFSLTYHNIWRIPKWTSWNTQGLSVLYHKKSHKVF